MMIIDDAERIERRMRLEDNEDDAFEYATLVAEGAARVLQNARIRGSMRKFAYKLIAYKGGVLDAALEEERAAIERELIAVDDEFGAAVYDEFLEAVNRCEEMWCPAKPHFVTIENKTTCTPALFLAMDAARQRIHEVAAELDRQYPRPAETSYVLADELRMFVEIAARHALKRAGVDVPKKHRGARVALRRFIARAKDAASRFVERLVRNPDDPDGQTMNAFMDALFGDVAAMLRIEGATHRSAKSRAASARRWVANEVNASWVRARGRDVGAGEAVRVDAFLRALVQSFDGNVRMFIARWTSLRDFAELRDLRAMFEGSAAKARYLSRWRAVVGDFLNERIGAALNVRNPPVAARHMNIWRPARFKQKCESFCPPRSRNFSVISKTCFTSLVNDTVMTDVDGATYFLRAEGRPVGYVPRTEFIRLGVDVVLKAFRIPKAPKGYTFARSIRVGPRAMVFGFVRLSRRRALLR